LSGTGSYTYSGYLRDGTSGKLALNKTGAGTQTFVGGNINYTGATMINSGTMVLQDVTGFNSAVTVNSGGTLTTSGTSNVGTGGSASLTLNGGTYTHTSTGYEVWSAPGGLTVGASGGTINVTNSGGNNQVFFDAGITGTGNLTINNTGSATTGVNF